jgi:hypothetical protein
MQSLKQVFALTLLEGTVLRVKDAASTTLGVGTGRVWVTEEGVREDRVLRASDELVLGQPGMTLIVAVERSRVELRTPRGVAAPHVVELAFGEGEPAVAQFASSIDARPPIPRPRRQARGARALPCTDGWTTRRAGQAADPLLQ